MGQPLEPFTYESPKLGEHEVRVSITHCGVCYTDIQGIDDHYGIVDFPFVPGHEIVGTVSAVGQAVSGLKEGDRVGIGWQGRSCMKCEWCLQGEEQLCQDIGNCGTWKPYGGFSSSVVVDGRFAYPLPAGMPSEVAAVLMCAGISVYTPLRIVRGGRLTEGGCHRCGRPGPSRHPVRTCPRVRSNGHILFAGEERAGSQVRRGPLHPCGGSSRHAEGQLSFDLLLYTSHAKSDWTSLLYSLKTNGRLALVGFPDSPVTFDPLELVVHQFSMTGSFIGSRAGMKEMLSFAQAHGIAPAVELMPMSQANDAILRVRENQARYRIVLFNDMDIV